MRHRERDIRMRHRERDTEEARTRWVVGTLRARSNGRLTAVRNEDDIPVAQTWPIGRMARSRVDVARAHVLGQAVEQRADRTGFEHGADAGGQQRRHG